ncbi:uncharacterized protein BDR25DRAFT_40034 [Lindgomyces ingoldianus]|uniref:Uncharacterized protein n=1 Tax=Lindgomyces ingoldianus TaxID=673940 RepID=A0ACB6QSG1_9PLEO|nr:uncharacterized protein BDR25DRAFT_40034 [Lindgomyces ingoldianus]KAF2469841.1 hypothetical protein BDR25DRAFT_40034 [Lindgomyces ingoldianus]
MLREFPTVPSVFVRRYGILVLQPRVGRSISRVGVIVQIVVNPYEAYIDYTGIFDLAARVFRTIYQSQPSITHHHLNRHTHYNLQPNQIHTLHPTTNSQNALPQIHIIPNHAHHHNTPPFHLCQFNSNSPHHPNYKHYIIQQIIRCLRAQEAISRMVKRFTLCQG